MKNLNLSEIQNKLYRIEDLEDLATALKSPEFTILTSAQKAQLLTEDGHNSVLISSMRNNERFKVIASNLSTQDKEAIFQDQDFIQKYVISATANGIECFEYGFGIMPLKAQKEAIKMPYAFHKNLFQNLIFTEKDYPIIKVILESDGFAELTSAQKTKLLTEEGDCPALYYAFFYAFSTDNNVALANVFLENNNEELNKILVGYIPYINEGEIPAFIDLLKPFEKFKTLKDNDGFSALYHLSQKPLPEADIKALQDSGFQEILPDEHNVQHFEDHDYYYS